MGICWNAGRRDLGDEDGNGRRGDEDGNGRRGQVGQGLALELTRMDMGDEDGNGRIGRVGLGRVRIGAGVDDDPAI